MSAVRFPADRLATRKRLFDLIKDRSFSRPSKITLASGKESNFYFNMKPTMLHPEGAALLPELILENLKGVQVDYVGGLAVGAIPLLSPLSMLSHIRGTPIPSFFVRGSVKDHGTQQRVEGLHDPKALEGKSVVILEDVTTTGGSAMIAVEAARNAGAKVILVLSIVDREEGAVDFFAAQEIEFRAIFRASEFLA
jgi:orotate phosphoribosyltransferase